MPEPAPPDFNEDGLISIPTHSDICARREGASLLLAPSIAGATFCDTAVEQHTAAVRHHTVAAAVQHNTADSRRSCPAAARSPPADQPHLGEPLEAHQPSASSSREPVQAPTSNPTLHLALLETLGRTAATRADSSSLEEQTMSTRSGASAVFSPSDDEPRDDFFSSRSHRTAVPDDEPDDDLTAVPQGAGPTSGGTALISPASGTGGVRADPPTLVLQPPPLPRAFLFSDPPCCVESCGESGMARCKLRWHLHGTTQCGHGYCAGHRRKVSFTYTAMCYCCYERLQLVFSDGTDTGSDTSSFTGTDSGSAPEWT